MVRLFLLSMIELLKVSDEIIAGVQFFYCRPVTRELHVSNFVLYTKSATNANKCLYCPILRCIKFIFGVAWQSERSSLIKKW